MAVDTIETWRIQQFRNNVEMALRERGGRLRSTIAYKGGYTGTKATVQHLLGETRAANIEGRFARIADADIPKSRRWIVPQRYGWAGLTDQFDEVLTGISLNGPYQQAAVEAMRLEEDLRILKTAFASALTGETGATAEPFTEVSTVGSATQNTIGVDVGGSNTGLNSAKLKAIVELFVRQKVNVEQPIYMGISERDWASLMAETNLLNSDYVSRQALTDGMLPPLMGITFIRYSSATLNEAGLYDGSHIYDLPVWVKDGMAMGSWDDMKADVVELKQTHWSTWRIQAQVAHGFTRCEPFKVLKVKTYY